MRIFKNNKKTFELTFLWEGARFHPNLRNFPQLCQNEFRKSIQILLNLIPNDLNLELIAFNM